MMAERYIVSRVLNNNIVQCKDIQLHRDCILLGNGIGFGKKKYDVIEEIDVEKAFVMEDKKNLTKYEKLVVSCDIKLVEVTEKIIVYLEEEFKTTYHEYLHIALLDHLNFSIYRYHNQIEVPNIFLEELSMMYQKEYNFAERMLDFTNKTLNIQLPKSEISFITMHIHAALKNKKVSKASLYAEIIKDCLYFIEDKLELTQKIALLERSRLILHLKFALERERNHIALTNPMTKSLRDEYPKTYQLATELAQYICEKYGIILPEGEIGYLTLHIQNIIMKGDDAHEYA